MIKQDLKLKPYKIPEYHELKASDPAKRQNFCLWFYPFQENTYKTLICLDEAYFFLTETVNKQSNRLWLMYKPTEDIERPLRTIRKYWFGVSYQVKGFMDHPFLKVPV